MSCELTLLELIMSFVLQLTIEHDPDALNRRRPSFPYPSSMITPPPVPSSGMCGSRMHPPDRERLFKRRDEGYISGSRSRQLRRGKGSCSKERSSSMSRLLEG